MTIIEWLKKRGYEVHDDMYPYIDRWFDWYQGKVKGFHDYLIYNGTNKISCSRKSLCMAKQVCQDWADLLLNEKVHINHPDQKTQDFIVQVLDGNNFWVRGNQAVEDAFWSGLVACVPYPDGVVLSGDGRIVEARGIRLSFSVGKQIIPLTIENGECTECAFTTDTKIGDKTYTVMQMCVLENGLYTIYNRVFDTTHSGIKEIENPAGIPQFAHIAAKWETGMDIPPFVFLRPNLKNNIDPLSPFGVSVFSGALDILRGLDTVYDAYINEYLLGKTRVMVQTEALNFESGRPVFDPNDVAYYQLPAGQGNPEKPYIEPIQPQIRAEAMQTGLNDSLNLLSMRCGFGERHYKFTDTNVTTATQVISENSHMFRTLKKHEIVLDAFFKGLSRLIVRYGREYLKLSLTDADITVDFDDSIIEDKASVMNDMRLDVSAGLLKPEVYLSKKYNVSVEEAREMMQGVEPEYIFAGGAE